MKTGRPEIGRRAVEALGPLSKRDDQALERLLAALDAKEWEVRRSAAETLETLSPADSPDANLTALQASYADLRRWGLLRLLQRQLLELPSVATALRRRAEDKDAEVRRLAFLLMLHARPALLASLRSRDPDLDRQLTDLESAPEGQGGSAGGVDRKNQPQGESETDQVKSDQGEG